MVKRRNNWQLTVPCESFQVGLSQCRCWCRRGGLCAPVLLRICSVTPDNSSLTRCFVVQRVSWRLFVCKCVVCRRGCGGCVVAWVVQCVCYAYNHAHGHTHAHMLTRTHTHARTYTNVVVYTQTFNTQSRTHVHAHRHIH